MNGENGTMNSAPQQASQPVQQASVNQMPAQTSSYPTSAGDDFAELKRLSAAGAERMARSGVNDNIQNSNTESEGNTDLSLPTGLVNNAAATASINATQQQQGQQTQQPLNQQNADQSQTQSQQQASRDDAEQQARDVISKITLRNAQGQTMDFENDTLVQIVQGFQHYNNQIQDIQQDYNQKYQNLEARRQELEANQSRIDSLMKSEKGFILEALESNPEFAEKIANLLSEQPDLLLAYQDRMVNTVKDQSSDEITKLKQQMNDFLQAQQQHQLQQQQQQQQTQLAQQQARQKAYYDNTVQTVQSKVAEFNKQFNLPARTLDALTAQAVLEVQSDRLQFEPQAISNWFGQQMQAIAMDFNNIKNQARSEYLTGKQQAAPPPPTGGGTPSVTNNTPPTAQERMRLVTQRLQELSNGIR